MSKTSDARRIGSPRAIRLIVLLAAGVALAPLPLQAEPPAARTPAQPVFSPKDRAVSTWRTEAADHLALDPAQAAAFRGTGNAPRVARCVKLNNYWCIKKAGWDGQIAADAEGHVAFASAVEGAAVAALLLRRYYVDFGRRSAMAIISRWAPAQCDTFVGVATARGPRRPVAPARLGNTLRARWLASHSRGFVTPLAGRRSVVKRSVVADHVERPMQTPTIAVGVGLTSRPMTLDALLQTSPDAPPSRSMLGMPRRGGGSAGRALVGSVSACGYDGARIASYAAKAAAGLTVGADGDLGLFGADGRPTRNLSIMMANMARVEIGPLAASPALVEAGIVAAFRPGRNPGTQGDEAKRPASPSASGHEK